MCSSCNTKQRAILNEFDVICGISARLGKKPEEVMLPIGDDCAVLRLGDKEWVAAADMLVSGYHFGGWASPEDVGYKAVAVNVSDVAAMGGISRFVLVSGGADESETTLRCMGGVLEACEEFRAYPLGGDTTRADALTVNVTILGELPGPAVLRSGARPGDLLAVTGELGASAAGFLVLESGETAPGRMIRKHLRPEPRVDAGLVASEVGVHAMIDLSDGLASDVRHVCEQSGVGCRIDLGLLPVSGDTREVAGSFDRDAEVLAATGGEDYELLMAVPERVMEDLDRRLDIPLTVVGKVTKEEEVLFVRDGEVVEGLSGWDHFASG